jgi:ABC-type multidrug transport system ATPase subunit
VHLAPPAFDLASLAQTGVQQRKLIVELVAYLQQRQVATSALVQDRSLRAERIAIAQRERHAELLDRLGQIDARLSRLDQQLDELRAITRPLRAEPTRSPNGVAVSANGHVKPEAIVEPPYTALRGPQLLRVESLAKEIGGTDILKEISFSIYEGEILGLIGPNGAGKTTLMECLAGMRPRSGGTFLIGDDDDAPASWDPKELLFYLPNNVLPYSELYTIEVLNFFGRLYEVEQARWEQIVLRDLSLGPVLGKRVSALSKGNMQRLLIALALMSPQPLLALDEPFDGLDLHQTQAMMGILRGLRGQSRTLLLCIHQLNDAERICDRLLLLSGGRLVGVGTLAELRTQTGLSEGSLEEIFLALT